MKQILYIMLFLVGNKLNAQLDQHFLQVGYSFRDESRVQSFSFKTGLYSLTNHGIQTHLKYISNKRPTFYFSYDTYYMSIDYFYRINFKKLSPIVFRPAFGLGYMYQSIQIQNLKRYGFGPNINLDVVYQYKRFGVGLNLSVLMTSGYEENVFSFTSTNGLSGDFKKPNNELLYPNLIFTLSYNL